MNTLRVLTSNIQSGLSATGERTDAAQLAHAYADVQADVVALQEVDRDQSRSDHLDQLQVIAGALDLPHARYGAALGGDVRVARQAPSSVGAHHGPAYGVGLASRYPIIAWFAQPLPRVTTRLPQWRGGRVGLGVHEPRVAVAAVIDAPGGPVAVASTHLSLIVPVATLQLRTVLRKVLALGHPAVVAGDFNLGYSTVARTAAGWQAPRALTFPADHPIRQIDHVLVRGARAGQARALRLPIADHRALAVEVSW